MKITKTLLFLLLFFGSTEAQQIQIIDQYTNQEGTLRYGKGPEDFMKYDKRGFTLILPEKNQPVKGTIVMLEDFPVDVKDTSKNHCIHIDKEAIPKGFAVLYIATGIPVDLYFAPSSPKYVDSVLVTVFKQFHLPRQNIFFLGVMVSGHRALKYVEYRKKAKTAFDADITGIVLCESAIDWIRQWYECQKQVRDSLTAIGYGEGKFITYLFSSKLKTTPVTNIDSYIEFSPYTYFDAKMRKPKLYKDLAVRSYTYADTRYWFSAQGHGVYDSNYPDMSGLINEEKLARNKNAELIVFHSNPEDPPSIEMRRQSTTWDLVDKEELINWMVRNSK
jgi:hypothetical protein